MRAEPQAPKLLIAVGPGEWRAAWLESGEPVELYVERGDTKPPDSIHLGRVVRIVSALDAAFIDIGDERPGFLPLRELPTRPVEGARLLVRVRREAWADKAPRLTVKMTAANLAALAARAAELEPPAQLHPPPGLGAALTLRLPSTPAQIVIDDTAALPPLRQGFPSAELSSRAADWPFDLDAVFDAALASSIGLPGGGTVHFAETAAAMMIDVDTGMPEGSSAERAALAANLSAAQEIARQLRLRNTGGPVIVDFVGLNRRTHRDQLSQAFAGALAGDPAKPELLGWTRLGHFELVRPRRGRSLADAMLEPRSPVKRPITHAHEALRRVLREARATPSANWRLALPPAVAVALRGPAEAALRTLETKLGRRIAIDVEPGRDSFDIYAL
jgi:ribonuclease G